MTRRKKRFVLIAVPSVLVLLLALSVALPMFPLGSVWKGTIQTKAVGADRMIIDPNILPNRNEGKAITVSGQDAVQDLLAKIEFEPVFLRAHCRCFGDVAIRFCNADRELLALTFHHGQSLRVHDANWAHNANAPLTRASRSAVSEWLQKHGYRPPTATTSAPE